MVLKVKLKVGDMESFENFGAIVVKTGDARVATVSRTRRCTMSSSVTLATRTFAEDDQRAFADLSGDFNPLHMDPLATRRTQAGAVVVHGVNGALWAIDKLAELGLLADTAVSLTVQFKKFVYVGDEVDLKLLRRDQKSVVAELWRDSLATTTLSVGFGSGGRTDEVAFDPTSCPLIEPKHPANLVRLQDLSQMAGRMEVAGPSRRIGQRFPHAESAIGGERTAAIALLSTLVGMVCPGLNSMFAAFSVRLDAPQAHDQLRFCVAGRRRFRMVRISVAGAGISGTVQAFACLPLPHDARVDAGPQLASLSRDISHLYYFATTPIAKQKADFFVPRVLDEFMQVYVRAFHDCCSFVAGRASKCVTAFYPSSVFVDDTPAGMIEYAMAKSAGEVLCGNINRTSAASRRG
jgi:acyl dehydratase